MPNRLPQPDYAANTDVRQVRSNGEIKWRGDYVHVCSALAGEMVAIEETDAGHCRVRFFDVPIGIIDENTRKLARCPKPATNGTGP
jgi:hypothetical protein